jgi:hypothetical protein
MLRLFFSLSRQNALQAAPSVPTDYFALVGRRRIGRQERSMISMRAQFQPFAPTFNLFLSLPLNRKLSPNLASWEEFRPPDTLETDTCEVSTLFCVLGERTEQRLASSPDSFPLSSFLLPSSDLQRRSHPHWQQGKADQGRVRPGSHDRDRRWRFLVSTSSATSSPVVSSSSPSVFCFCSSLSPARVLRTFLKSPTRKANIPIRS